MTSIGLWGNDAVVGRRWEDNIAIVVGGGNRRIFLHSWVKYIGGDIVMTVCMKGDKMGIILILFCINIEFMWSTKKQSKAKCGATVGEKMSAAKRSPRFEVLVSKNAWVWQPTPALLDVPSHEGCCSPVKCCHRALPSCVSATELAKSSTQES